MSSTAIIENASEQINLKTSLRFILASQSIMRRKALEIIGLSFECIPANIDEKAIRHSDPLKMALMLSEAKARTIAAREKGVIISGDAFVVYNGKVFEKPSSLDEAHAMLNELSGKTYSFITGLVVYDTFTEKMRSTVETCKITLRQLDNEEIIDYCNRYPVLNYAGAHEADGVARFSEKIEGCCTIATSFPMKDLVQFLREVQQDRKAIN